MATQRVVIQLEARGGRTTERAIRRVGTAASSAQKAVNGFRNVLVALAAVSAAKGLVDFVDTATRIDNRLRLLSGSTIQVNKDFERLLAVATNTRSSLESTIELYARFERSTRQLGLSQEELIQLTTATNQAFQIYGATAEEARAAVVQFSQGLAAGALRGDELRSVLEQGPRLAQALADGLTEIEAFGPGVRVAIGDLRDLGFEGELTADRVTKALATQADALDREFQQTNRTVNQAFQEIQNQFIAGLREIEQSEGAFSGLADGLFLVAENIDLAFDVLQDLITGFQVLGDGIGIILTNFNDVVGIFDETRNSLLGLDEAATDFTLTASGATLALTLLFGPLGFAAGLAGSAAVAFGQLRNSTTELTDAAGALATQIEIEFDAVGNLTSALDENRIISVQTANTKLQEAIARRENIISVQDEARAKRDALRQEIEGILIRARALQDRKSDAPLGALVNLDENIALIQLEGQVQNAFEAYQQLDRQVSSFDTTLEQNQSNIDRINALIADGTKLTDFSTEGIKRREAAEEQLEDALKEREKLEEKIANTTEKFFQSLELIPQGAGKGSDALDDLARATENLNKIEIQGLITAEDVARARTEIAELTAGAQVQAVEDIVAALQLERQNLALSEEALEARRLLLAAGFSEENITPALVETVSAEVAALNKANEALELREKVLTDLQNLENEILGDRQAIIDQFTQLNILYEQGRISADQYASAVQRGQEELSRLALAAGDGTLRDALITGLAEARGEYTNFIDGLTTEFGSLFSSLKQGFADSLASAIVEGEDLNEALKSVAREGLTQLLSGLIQLGIQFLLNQAIASTAQGAALAQGAATAGALASAYAPAAALASLASFGGNAAPASAAVVGTVGLAEALAAAGSAFATGAGEIVGPGTGTSDNLIAAVSPGEGIATARANKANAGAIDFMNKGGRVEPAGQGGKRPVYVTMTFPNGDADSFRRSRRQIARELKTTLETVE